MAENLQSQSLALATDLAEVGIDQILADGILRDIPVLGTAVKLASIGLGVRDALFIRKIQGFLNELSSSAARPEQTRAAKDFIERCTPDQTKRMGETVAMILDRMSDMEKPAILAKVFRALALGQIDFDQFRRLSIAVDLAFVDDLLALTTLQGRRDSANPGYLDALQVTGLTRLASSGTAVGSGVVYHPVLVTELGAAYIRVVNSHSQ